MLELSGYNILQKIAKNDRFEWHHVQRKADGNEYIAKTSVGGFWDTRSVASFHYEQDLLRHLALRGLSGSCLLEHVDGKPVLLFQQLAGESMSALLEPQRWEKLSMGYLLQAAVALTERLEQLHHEQVVMLALPPSSLLYDDVGQQMHFMDYSLGASVLGHGSVQSGELWTTELLAYVSPEVVGQPVRTDDMKADIYSLGIVLYEWFTGHRPFTAKNAGDLMYSHRALLPELPHQVNSKLPEMLSRMIFKCLGKDGNTSYQAVSEVRNDLVRCLEEWEHNGEIPTFELSAAEQTKNVSGQLHGLHGRWREREWLLREIALTATVGERARILAITGESGIGKTLFMTETLKQSWSGNSRYYSIKAFEEQHMESPYQAWLSVLDRLLMHVLNQSALQVEVWRVRLLEVLGEYGGLLTERVCSLKELIGEQPPLPPVSPDGALSRFTYVLNRVLQLFMTHEDPLVIGLDDIQWADAASLQYLLQLLQDPGTRNLCVIVSYRSESETSHTQLPHSWEQGLAELGLPVHSLQLQALPLGELEQLLQDTFGERIEQQELLLELLWNHTKGQPLILEQVLQDALHQGLLYFQNVQGSWQWNQEIFQTLLKGTEHYFATRLAQKSQHALGLLGAVAVAGSRCDVAALSALTGCSEEEAIDLLESAVQEHLLVYVPEEGKRSYRFYHDRIRQAAYSYLKEETRQELHRRMGELLLVRLRGGEEVSPFEIAYHWNLICPTLPLPEEERLLLIRLNMAAGAEAKRAYAYEEALVWWQTATKYSYPGDWELHYTIMFQLYMEQAEAAMLCALESRAYEVFAVLTDHAATDMDSVKVLTGRIRLEASYNRNEQAVALCRQALALLGEAYRLRTGKGQLLRQWIRIKQQLWRQDIASLAELPPLEDEVQKLAITVLAGSTDALFVADPAAWVAATLLIMNITLKHGQAPESAIGYVGYAMMLYYQRDDRNTYKWGKLALALSRPYPELHIRVQTAFTFCYDSWRQFEPELAHQFAEFSANISMETGDLRQGNHNVIVNAVILLMEGRPLSQIYDQLQQREHEFDRLNNTWQKWTATGLVAIVSRLIGERSSDERYPVGEFHRRRLAGEGYGDDDQLIRELALYFTYLTGFLFGEYDEALAALEQSIFSSKLRKSGSSDNVVQYFYEGLVLVRIYEMSSGDKQQKYRGMIRKLIGRMRRIAKRAPALYTQKWLLLRAEAARLDGKFSVAETLYEQALEQAANSGYMHELAMIAECYGRYGIQRGKVYLARHYLTEACNAYEQWGAIAKVRDMEHKYSSLLQRKHPSGLEEADMMSLIEAGYALSGEIEMIPLISGLLRMMLYNAGAEYGAVILCDEQKNSYTIEAHGTRDQVRIETRLLETEDEVAPAALISYAINTKSALVLDHACHEGQFTRQDYVKRKKLKSVLCLPIMTQQRLIAVLYLESSLIAGLFTARRQEVLRLLGMQWAVTLSNARLYAEVQHMHGNLEQQVEERTRELERSMKEASAALAEISIFEERHRIAQDIHDVVGHTLTSVVLQMEASKRLLKKDREEGLERLQQAQNLARSSLEDIRQSVHLLREDRYADLPGILHELMESTEQNTSVRIHAQLSPISSYVSMSAKKVIYHALQEGLTNGIRHGHSTEFHFLLEEKEQRLLFSLLDNGRGLRGRPPGFGLRGMRERVEQLGGTMTIEDARAGGCRLQLMIPLSFNKY
ncbi:AAA family ATPase [Paenibacillus massiliensis]|uniref:AAA family ATPase n=1 Tax=Paenibacillus massiliensis TaxID=225917 RepID=UPI00036F154A|nr:AAA family ATPase [Paenibacillus massiliensis]